MDILDEQHVFSHLKGAQSTTAIAARITKETQPFTSRFVALYRPTGSQLSRKRLLFVYAKKGEEKPPAIQTTTTWSSGTNSWQYSTSQGFTGSYQPPPRAPSAEITPPSGSRTRRLQLWSLAPSLQHQAHRAAAPPPPRSAARPALPPLF